jgi:hypothetical protein
MQRERVSVDPARANEPTYNSLREFMTNNKNATLQGKSASFYLVYAIFTHFSIQNSSRLPNKLDVLRGKTPQVFSPDYA